MDLTALSVSTITASGGGTLAYDNNTGIFTYAPADLSSLASTTYVTTQINAVKDRITSPNDLHITYIDNTGTTTFGGNAIPGNSTYTLGTVAQPWKDIYVSQGSIIIADTDPLVDGVSISNTSEYLVIDRGGLKITDDSGLFEIFQLDNTGKLLIKSEIPLSLDNAAFEIIGNLQGTSLPIVNRGVMIHSSGAVNIPSRVYIDGVGTQTTAPYESAYAAFIGRYARGTVASPQPAQTDDLIVRFGGNAYASTTGLNSISNVRMDMVATETQSSTGRGSKIEFWTTAMGSATPTQSMHIDSQGIDISDAADVNAGITFKNGSILRYWPAVTGNTGKILRTDGTNFFWDTETVPSGSVLFKGDWDASTNTPSVSNATGTLGWQYIVSVAGTQNLGAGSVAYAVGDQIIHNGSVYIRIPAPTAQIQTNWTETNSALPAFIQNKPTLSTVAITGSWNDLLNKPTIPAAQINSDWNSVSGLSQILNKPTIPTQYTDALARAAITLSSNAPTGTTSTLTYVSGAFTFTSAAALVSGTTIKTVNSNSLLGSGNVSVGTVTSVGGTGTVSGISLGGTVTGSGSLSLSGTLSGITNTNLSGTAGITNANLANSTISGVALGGTLFSLTAGTNVTFSTGSTYNGSQAITVNVATGAGYTLPAATTTTLGGVVIPAVATSGISNSSGTIGLAVATTTQLGGVKVDGTTIAVNGSGVISSLITQGVTAVTPTTLNATTHIVGSIAGTTLTLSTDATTAATPSTIVVRDSTGTINVSGWTVGARLTAVNYTATTSDYWIGTSAKSKTITLPNAANGAVNGRQYQIADVVHTGNPGTTIAAQSPATVTGNQPSQQSQIVLATYLGGVWYLN
jgi:hypothetical protein